MMKRAWNAPRVTRTAPSLCRVGAARGAETEHLQAWLGDLRRVDFREPEGRHASNFGRARPSSANRATESRSPARSPGGAEGPMMGDRDCGAILLRRTVVVTENVTDVLTPSNGGRQGRGSIRIVPQIVP